MGYLRPTSDIDIEMRPVIRRARWTATTSWPPSAVPMPTWPAHDSKFFGLEVPDTVQMKGQERAYTSPIWYTP